MVQYRVHFFKNLLSSDGHEFKCRQRVIEIEHARSDDRALKAAQLRFKRLTHVGSWRTLADCCELETPGDHPEQGACERPRI